MVVDRLERRLQNRLVDMVVEVVVVHLDSNNLDKLVYIQCNTS